MSYDFSMYTTAGSDEKIYTDLDLNCTYNVGSMFCKALPQYGNGIRFIDGMTGEASELALKKGLIDMIENPKSYEDMNPSNGWGNSKMAKEVLETLYEYSRKYPLAIFEIS